MNVKKIYHWFGKTSVDENPTRNLIGLIFAFHQARLRPNVKTTSNIYKVKEGKTIASVQQLQVLRKTDDCKWTKDIVEMFDARAPWLPSLQFTTSKQGKPLLFYNGYTFRLAVRSGPKSRWTCSTHWSRGCRAFVYLIGNNIFSNKQFNTVDQKEENS
ncbi:hypothetical protein MSG28_008207 [Choristoneura fumiferana]|uniref:Uncharacterized protein n=1 Tax=Choristoneura fumiferana TaxID=7141 RepID=A0ACC0JAK8_CHOFU|nr:hypothetical protein MSG28_008207 [Choristoneura fumiferana]